jgi:hypothetical protein
LNKLSFADGRTFLNMWLINLVELYG